MKFFGPSQVLRNNGTVLLYLYFLFPIYNIIFRNGNDIEKLLILFLTKLGVQNYLESALEMLSMIGRSMLEGKSKSMIIYKGIIH
jgi:hypothetical protein